VTLVHYTIADRIRPEAVEAIKSIHALGIQTVLLTGDAKLVAQAIAQELGALRVASERRALSYFGHRFKRPGLDVGTLSNGKRLGI
jgi:magnesium-transporting ATPase (P-type)